MSEIITGGCLCGALRYVADRAPDYAGYCCCEDCRRASGSAFIPFMGFPATALRVTGDVVQVRSRAVTGGEAVRNRCAACGSLVFGGALGVDREHTVYAGTLDDPTQFQPTMLLFERDRPAWAVLPPSLAVFDTMPG